MNTRAKRLALPLAGAVAASGMIAASFTTSAQAAPKPASETLVKDAATAYSVAKFWLEANGAALKKAKEYNWDAKDVTKLVRGDMNSGGTDDGKAGKVDPTGSNKGPSGKVKNINLPRTIGKVFFVDSKGQYRWCSGTSIQARHRNLVATAGHCVYDLDGNKHVMDKWVFVPGYHQGKAPWGVYVGQQAFTHYNLSAYEDYDHDYAFVAVSNGIAFAGSKEVSFEEYQKWQGDKWIKPVEISREEYGKCLLNLGHCWAEGKDTKAELVGPDYPGAVLQRKEVSKQQYDRAKTGKGNGNKLGEPVTEPVTRSEWLKIKSSPGFKGRAWADKRGNYYITRYYVQEWVKPGSVRKYYRDTFHVALAKDLGALGNVVGGQGLAWNQKVNQKVFVFGYPADAHPDGDKPYSGLTAKHCYGTTASKVYKVDAFKVAAHIALKCSMTGGADGSPWLIKYSNAKRLGLLNGVTSLFHDQDGNNRVDYNSSPYFDGETYAIYDKASYVQPLKLVGPQGEVRS